jgi:hypothetical protein
MMEDNNNFFKLQTTVETKQETRNGCVLIADDNQPYKHAINPVSTS